MAMTCNDAQARTRLSLTLLAAAPHRLLFFVGAVNVLAAMAWWAAWLVALRWPTWSMPQPPLPMPAGWGHGLVMSYQVFTPFIFGFLLTVFPRWTGRPALDRWHYVPIGLGLFGGQALTLIGLCGLAQVLHAGLLLTAAGWLCGLLGLGRVLRGLPRPDWHALSCLAAATIGLVGLMLFVAWWHAPAHGLFGFAALKLGVLGFLLPTFLTVVHRMLPFFAAAVVPGYRVWRPNGLLAAIWTLLATHLALELRHDHAWLWLPDLALAALACLWLWRIWPAAAAGTRLPGLLLVLFVALCWLPLAFALYAAQSLLLATTGEFLLGRAPVHALTIGLFGSLLVAMVTRVTHGHSGRPLAMSATAWFAFVAVQVTAIMRVAAELAADAWAWQALAALAWLLAFLPWVARHTGIYLAPRVDGKSG